MNGSNSAQMTKAWADAIENQRRLRECPQHNFSVDLRPNDRLGKRYQCVRCQGDVNSSEKMFYELGLKHGAQRNT